jgi:hypothetical protein
MNEDENKIAEDLDRELNSLAKKCPDCHSEMEKGFLTARMFFWSKEPHNIIAIWPRFTSHVLTKGVETLARGENNITILAAYRCTKCKLVLFNYGENGDATKVVEGE